MAEADLASGAKSNLVSLEPPQCARYFACFEYLAFLNDINQRSPNSGPWTGFSDRCFPPSGEPRLPLHWGALQSLGPATSGFCCLHGELKPEGSDFEPDKLSNWVQNIFLLLWKYLSCLRRCPHSPFSVLEIIRVPCQPLWSNQDWFQYPQKPDLWVSRSLFFCV